VLDTPNSRGPRRAWLVLVVITVPFFLLLGLLFLFTSKDRSDVDEFNEELRKAAENMYLGYTEPVTRVSEQTTTLCPYIQPGSDSSDCAMFIEALKDANSKMVGTIGRLESLLGSPPAGVSQELITRMDNVLSLLKSVAESNRFLIEGWYERDEVKWIKGWRLRESLAAEVQGSER
jgi:hypothetical protein